MNNKGFTLVEILAVLIILGIVMALSIPAYQGVFRETKRSNYNSKILEIEIAANKYGEKIKDEIKDSTDSCVDTSVSELITKGVLVSEDKIDNVIYSPIDETPMNSKVRMCYCRKKFEVKSFYIEEFNENNTYAEKEKIIFNKKMYIVRKVYIGSELENKGIDATFREGKKTKRYFEEISC